MQYTKYISSVIQSQGTPILSTQSFGALMNIVYLEGAIASLEKVKSKNKVPSSKHKYDLWIKDYSDKLDAITEKRSPENLIKLITQM